MSVQKYIAITSKGTIAYSFSTDRNTWKVIKESNLKNYPIKAITYGRDKYVAVGKGIIIFSYDCIHWEKVEKPDFEDISFNDVIYAKNRFIAVGKSGVIFYSTKNTDEWKKVKDSKLKIKYKEIFHQDRLREEDYNIIDPNYFNEEDEDEEGESDSNYGEDKYVEYGTIDKEDRKEEMEEQRRELDEIKSEDEAFKAGLEWYKKSVRNSIKNKSASLKREKLNNYYDNLDVSVNIFGIAYGDDEFVAIGDHGKVASSKEGIVWNEIAGIGKELKDHYGVDDIDTNDYSFCMAYGGKKLIAVYPEYVFASLINGVWSLNVITGLEYTTSGFSDIAYGKNRFVVVGGRGTIIFSSDQDNNSFNGIAWVLVKHSTFGQDKINAITYGGNSFVAVGEKGKIAYSSDGIIWTKVEKSPFKEEDDDDDDIRFILAVPLEN
jgi:photosystem II stability/assembly factor-like uncharacterized protein